jgi:hypothetical protein
MKKKVWIILGLVAVLLAAVTSVAVASNSSAKPAGSFAEAVRNATEQFKDVEKAKKAKYALLHGCTSGQQDGAMGAHYANGDLVGDGELDVAHPEVLLYEPTDDGLKLAAVEYVVIADAWNAKHKAPPVLMGQLFNLVGAPNRYGIPAFYELHVWAWKSNSNGMFADWNPRVSCENFAGDPGHEGMH